MNNSKNDLFSKAIRAGKRTYFFDVKSTKGEDVYLTITESKKSFENGKETFQKHKLFLYKEDFEKFQDGFTEALDAATSELESRGISNEKKDLTEVDFTFDQLK